MAELKQRTFIGPSEITVGEWLDVWLDERKKSSLFPTTWQSYEKLFRVHVKPAIGHIPLGELRAEHLQKFCEDKLKEGLSPRTVRYMRSLVRQALKQAAKSRLAARGAGEAAEPPWRTKGGALIH